MTEGALRAAVIGVGHLGRHHARILSSVEGATLTAVVDVNEPRAREVAAACGARPLTDARDLAGQVDLVSIATPTEVHAEVAVACVDRGIPVLVEKPLARSVAEADLIIAAAAKSDAALAVGHTERFNPAVIAIRFAFFRSIYTGLITITVAFFVLEFILQRRVIPYIFPDGGLSAIAGTRRIRIRIKLTAFLFACNIIPLVSILQNTQGRLHADESLIKAMGQFQSDLVIEFFVFMAVGIWLTFLVSSNLTKPLQEITQILRKVQNGLFETKVRVTSNDEIGYAGDVINAMTEGLIERDRIKQSLTLAKEIQQNILPRDTLDFEGFDVAGKNASRYFRPSV